MQTEQYWDDAAADYDAYPDHGLLDPDTRGAWKDLLRTWLPAQPCHVADLACGTGTMSALLCELGHEVTAVDSSREMVARARAKLAPFGAAARVVRGEVSDPDLAKGSVDVVLARHILWALPNPRDALRSWAGLVRADGPGGRLLLIEGVWGDTGAAADRMPWAAGVPSTELRAVLEDLEADVRLVPLWDRVFWGKDISHERYVVVADIGDRR